MHKKMLDDFHTRLMNDFDKYFKCHGNGTKPLDEFVTFLIDHHLIDQRTIRRYTILREFDRQLNQLNGEKNKTTLVGEMARKYNISERSVWSILKGGPLSFFRNDKRTS